MMIYVLVDQSNTGKDSLARRLLEEDCLKLHRFLYCTTRPKRESEENGREYWFKTDEECSKDIESGKVVELRSYTLRDKTVYYYTLDYIDCNKNYIITATLEQCASYIKYYGVDMVKPIRIMVSDYDRLLRGIERERSNRGDYYEVCRRFLDEFTEYTEENFSKVQFIAEVENIDYEVCYCTLRDIIGGSR